MQLDDFFAKVQELPSIPKVVQELIQTFQDDNVDIDGVAKKIGMDQMLTAKVMRLANSARYGGNRKVASINDAVIRVGFNSLRTLVLASAFVSAFKPPEGFDLLQFWRQSFANAELCRWLARYGTIDAETAFTCGMLSNMGRLMAHMIDPTQAQEIQRVVDKGGFRRFLEQNAWGFTTDDMGAKLADMWKFPAIIETGIKYQNTPGEAPTEDAAMPCTLYLAYFIQDAHQKGLSDEEIIATFPNNVARHANLRLASLLDHLADCRNLDSGIEELLN